MTRFGELITLFLQETETEKRKITLVDLLTDTTMNGGDRFRRRKSLHQRLGLKNIVCCGSTWGFGSSAMTSQTDNEDDDDENDVVVELVNQQALFGNTNLNSQVQLEPEPLTSLNLYTSREFSSVVTGPPISINVNSDQQVLFGNTNLNSQMELEPVTSSNLNASTEFASVVAGPPTSIDVNSDQEVLFGTTNLNTWVELENATSSNLNREFTSVITGPPTSMDVNSGLECTFASPRMNLADALAAERQLRSAAEAGEDFQGNELSREEGKPLKMSLMRLLEESEMEGEDEETCRDEMCCVCMGRKKGAALIPCGHTFCRVCCRELWLNRGTCPLCNRSILEILDIY